MFRYYARVDKVYPPKYSTDQQARDAYKDSLNSPSVVDDEPHAIVGDIKIPAKEANAKDDPNLYFYWVHILELEKDKGDKSKAASKSDHEITMVGSLMEVTCTMMRFEAVFRDIVQY